MLRNAFATLAVLFALGLLALSAAPAGARVMAFGPQWSPFTLDVPEGWDVEPYAIGVVLRPNADDRRNAITCAVSRNGGQTARELAEQAIRGLRQRDAFAEWTIAREEMTVEGDIARLSPVAATLRVSPALRASPGPF